MFSIYSQQFDEIVIELAIQNGIQSDRGYKYKFSHLKIENQIKSNKEATEKEATNQFQFWMIL